MTAAATASVPKGAKHGTWRVFDQFGCQGYRGFEEVLRKVRFQGLRRECRAELADLEERRSRDRAFSRDVRQEYSHLQPRLGQQRSETRLVHRRPRSAAP